MSDTTGDAMALSNQIALPTQINENEIVLAEATLERARNGTFATGQSGNPLGRARGSRNRATLAVQALLDGEAEVLSRKMIAAAKDGDKMALKFCMERLVPRMIAQPVNITLPPVNTQADVLAAQSALIEATAKGEIEPAQARSMALMLDLKRQSIESIEFEHRLGAVEERMTEAIAAVEAAP